MRTSAMWVQLPTDWAMVRSYRTLKRKAENPDFPLFYYTSNF